MISVMRFEPVLRIAGPVEKTPSFLPGSSSASKWSLKASQHSTAPRKAPTNCGDDVDHGLDRR